MVSWGRVIEQTKEQVGIASYAELARMVDVRPNRVSDVRRGQSELPGHAKAKLLILSGRPIDRETYVALHLGPVRGALDSAATDLFAPHYGARLTSEFWYRCVEQVKVTEGYRTYGSLASGLGFSQSQISNAKAGRAALSPRAKILILDRLACPAGIEVLIDILPPRVARVFLDSPERIWIGGGPAGQATRIEEHCHAFLG